MQKTSGRKENNTSKLLHYITAWGMFYQETKVVEGCMIGFTYICLIVKYANLNWLQLIIMLHYLVLIQPLQNKTKWMSVDL